MKQVKTFSEFVNESYLINESRELNQLAKLLQSSSYAEDVSFDSKNKVIDLELNGHFAEISQNRKEFTITLIDSDEEETWEFSDFDDADDFDDAMGDWFMEMNL